jgi:hypothetical protein
MANLASTYQNQGRWNEAEQLELEVMESRKKKLGPEHPDTLTSMANLAFTWKSQGRSNDALALMTKCVESCKVVLGLDHPDTKSSSQTLEEWRQAQQPRLTESPTAGGVGKSRRLRDLLSAKLRLEEMK